MLTINSNYSLKRLNTFKVGYEARFFLEVHSEKELIEVLREEIASKNPLLILGGGSNILFTSDFQGLVIKNSIKGISVISEDENHIFVEAKAGENWHEFVLHCVENGYAGLENLSLIPGCVGACPIQNIGAYGVEVKDVIEEVHAIDIKSLIKESYSNEDCKFGYRSSIFKYELKGQKVITSVIFKLNKKANLKTSYGAIEEELQKLPTSTYTIKDISNAVISIRNSKLPNPEVLGNAGSFFKNPIISRDLYKKIAEIHPQIPFYDVDENNVKVPAGWLIEQSGWKGKQIGQCGVHNKQALVIVNHSNATGKEIFDLSTNIKSDVFNKFGIDIEREVNIL